MTLLCKNVLLRNPMNRMTNRTENSKEGNGSKMADLPMMMLCIILAGEYKGKGPT
jgi:hypothetical protein